MHIGIAGPIATESVAHHLDRNAPMLPPGYGGAPLLGTLIDALVARGHTVSAFTTSPGYPLPGHGAHRAEGERFEIFYVPVRPRAFRPSGGYWGRAADFFAVERAALAGAMRRAAPDVIHAHWSYEFGLAAIASGLPHVVTCHDAPQVVLRYMPNAYRLVRYFMAGDCLAHANCVTAVSPYLMQALARYRRAPITVVPNPLPPVLTSGRSVLDRRPNQHAPRVVMVANGWGSRKNAKPALRAFGRLRAHIPNARLYLYGADFGPGEVAARWAARNGIAQGMEFLGRIPYGMLMEEVGKADVLIHPSLEETFGMSVAEAMALGVPVIGGASSGAIPWVIGSGGLVVDVTSDRAIAHALRQLIGDESLYAVCRLAAAARVMEFSADRIAATYETLYAAAAGHRGRLDMTRGGIRRI